MLLYLEVEALDGSGTPTMMRMDYVVPWGREPLEGEGLHLVNEEGSRQEGGVRYNDAQGHFRVISVTWEPNGALLHVAVVDGEDPPRVARMERLGFYVVGR